MRLTPVIIQMNRGCAKNAISIFTGPLTTKLARSAEMNKTDSRVKVLSIG